MVFFPQTNQLDQQCTIKGDILLEANDNLWFLFREFSIVVTSFLIGYGFIVPIVQWVKLKLKLSGYKVVVLLAVSSIIAAIFMAVAEGVLKPEAEFTASDFSTAITYIVVWSQIRYNSLKREVLEKNLYQETYLSEDNTDETNLKPFQE